MRSLASSCNFLCRATYSFSDSPTSGSEAAFPCELVEAKDEEDEAFADETAFGIALAGISAGNGLPSTVAVSL